MELEIPLANLPPFDAAFGAVGGGVCNELRSAPYRFRSAMLRELTVPYFFRIAETSFEAPGLYRM